MSFKGVSMVMGVLGCVMSTMFIVFICIRLIVARIQMASMSTRSDPRSLECGFHGLDRLVVANFPTKKYDSSSFPSSDESQCVICLAEYRKDDILRVLPYCGHFFHSLCIDKWLYQHSTCPVCRISLRELPKRNRMPPLPGSSIDQPHYRIDRVDFEHYCCLSATREHFMRDQVDHRIDQIRENL